MALLCTVLVSVWITWIFLIHLSVKVILMMIIDLEVILMIITIPPPCDGDDPGDDFLFVWQEYFQPYGPSQVKHENDENYGGYDVSRLMLIV